MAQYAFGAGSLWGINDVPNATPIRMGALQGVSLDVAFTQKELYGERQYPLALARGTAKITGRAAFAKLNAAILNDLFFNEPTNPSTGQILLADRESATIPGTPFQITVANAANFRDDLGVIFQATGLPLVKVASSPAAGQYSVSAGGVYTFNTADTTKVVRIDYSYNNTTTGKKMTITNKLLGQAPFFKCVLSQVFQGKQVTFVLNRCMSSKLTFATKLEDFVIPDFDFAAFADDADNIGELSMGE